MGRVISGSPKTSCRSYDLWCSRKWLLNLLNLKSNPSFLFSTLAASLASLALTPPLLSSKGQGDIMSNYPLQWWLYTITRGPFLHSGLLSGDLASFDLANGCFINVSFGSRNFVCLITFSLFFPLAGWAMMLNDKHLCLALFWSSFSFRDLRFHLLVLTLFALYHEVLISFAL